MGEGNVPATRMQFAAADVAMESSAGTGPLRSALETRTRRGAFAQTLLLPFRSLDLTLAVLVVAAFVVASVAPQAVTRMDPLATNVSLALHAPDGEHWFGTDQLGRDIFARVVHGARLSLFAAFLAVALALVVGSVLGAIAGRRGGWVDTVIARLFDAILAIPGILMIFAVLAVLGNSIVHIACAIAINGSVAFGRLMRAEVLRVGAMTYVEAASALGVKPVRIMFRHVVPNAVAPVIALAALEIGSAMLMIGAMGYLGLGAQPPTPEWGVMIADGQKYLRSAWWIGVLPGVAFVIVVMALNRISRQLARRNHVHS